MSRAALAILLFLAVSSISAAKTCVKPIPGPDAKFCSRPPSAPVTIESYKGRWFLTHFSGTASRFSQSDSCTTANYTLKADNTIDVLNCGFTSKNETVPSCVTAKASRQPGGKTGELQVQFFPAVPPAPYIVAAIVGNPTYEYAAAAVYSCSMVRGELDDGFFIIMRNPYRPNDVLKQLKKQLRCRGYDVSRQNFIQSKNGKDCKYFFGPDGFVISRLFSP